MNMNEYDELKNKNYEEFEKSIDSYLNRYAHALSIDRLLKDRIFENVYNILKYTPDNKSEKEMLKTCGFYFGRYAAEAHCTSFIKLSFYMMRCTIKAYNAIRNETKF